VNTSSGPVRLSPRVTPSLSRLSQKFWQLGKIRRNPPLHFPSSGWSVHPSLPVRQPAAACDGKRLGDEGKAVGFPRLTALLSEVECPILRRSTVAGSGEPSLAQRQPQNQDDHNHDSGFVDGIHGWRWRILDFIQCEEPQSTSASRFTAGALGFLGAGNFLFRSQYKIIKQQLLRPPRPSCRVSGVSPYKPHHDRVQLKGLSSFPLIRGHSRTSKQLRHPSDGAASVYGRHRIATIRSNFVLLHLLHFFSKSVPNSPPPHASPLALWGF